MGWGEGEMGVERGRGVMWCSVAWCCVLWCGGVIFCDTEPLHFLVFLWE